MINDTRADNGGDDREASSPPANGAAEKPREGLAGVRYGAMNWIGEFRYRPSAAPAPGRKVVIQSDRGIELGEQVALTCPTCSRCVRPEQVATYVSESGLEFYRPNGGRILRQATEQDITEHDRLNAHNMQDILRCAALARELALDMKVVTAEHLLGGERVVFYFRAEGRIDFRGLVRELARHYQTRIEMRQVGARDEARLVADYEVCGRECCCKNFLKKLRPVTMKMAKLQKSTLDPSKVSGRCGRLRCCLRYEHDGYEELAARLPRIGRKIETAAGPGTVTSVQILTQLVQVRLDDGREMVFPEEELSPEHLAAQKSAAAQTPRDEPTARDQTGPSNDAGKPAAPGSGRRRRRRGEADGAGPRPRQTKPPRDENRGPRTDQPVDGPPPPAGDGIMDAPAESPQPDAEAGEERGPKKKRRRRRPRGRRRGSSPTEGDAE